MRWVNRSFAVRLFIFTGTNMAAMTLVILLEPYLDGLSLFIKLATVTIVALFCGFVFGAITAIIAVTIHNYFFQFPLYSLQVSDVRDAFKLALFLGVALIISWMGSSLRKLYLKAEKTKKQFQDESDDRAILLRIVSHDLKNYVHGIKLNCELISHQFQTALSKNKDSKKCMERLLWSTDRMEHLIVSLLELEKIKQGRLELDLKPEDPGDLLKEVVHGMEPLAFQKKIKIAYRPHNFGIFVLCDRERIIEVLNNVIGNAIKFTPQNGVISIHLDHAQDQVRFHITDSGPGIDPKSLSKIFELYWQGKPTDRIGTGLGLSISKRIIEAHQGHIWAESELNVGSTFHFSIPMAKFIGPSKPLPKYKTSQNLK